MAKEVFIIQEAQAALYLADENGDPIGAALYQDCCLEGLSLEQSYAEERLERHGRPFAAVHHTDEEHTIQIENWWSVEEDGGELLDPDLERNQAYVLVVVFHSERYDYWVKRVYRGVTARSTPLGFDTAATDNKTLRAESYFQVKGLNSAPDLSATITGEVVSVTSGVETLAYTYDFDAETFTSTGQVANTVAGIDEGGAGVPAGTDWYLAIGTVPVLWLENDVLRLDSVRAVNDFELPDPDGDRVEFRLSGSRYLVAMATGEVVCRNAIEQAAPADTTVHFVIRNGSSDWKASLRAGGILAETLTETTP